MTVRIRAATLDDVPELEAITLASETGPADAGDLVRPDLTGVHAPYLTFLVGRGRMAVAELGDRPIGYGATVDTGRSTHLADLFVRPEHQGTGVGRRLLDEVYGDAWPRTTFGSDDPRAVPLYLRAGMGAHWPNLYLTGDPGRLPAPDAAMHAEPSTVDAVAAVEAEWSGVDRGPDLDYWRSLPDGRPIVVRRAGRIVAAGIGRDRFTGPGRWVHDGMAAPDADGPTALLALLAATLAGDGVSVAGACIPGPSPLARTLLGAGFRIADRDTFLASDPTLIDPLRSIVNTGVL
jgi:GNAT superfamily N-acetyltransferase